MARVPRWTSSREDGVLTISLKRWRWFDDFLRESVLENTSYIFRGQIRAKWKLESTLDRAFRTVGVYDGKYSQALRRRHLRAFKLAARGRRGSHPPELATDDDWWALGQHSGLATPLLDWTRSPYVAAYFAFAPPPDQDTERRVIYALQAKIIADYCAGKAEVAGEDKSFMPPNGALGKSEHIRTFVPFSDENARLVSQSGLFTIGPEGGDIEAWVRGHFAGARGGILVKVYAPESDRDDALLRLTRMNINHLSLFPDLYGSSKYCNLALAVPGYDASAV